MATNPTESTLSEMPIWESPDRCGASAAVGKSILVSKTSSSDTEDDGSLGLKHTPEDILIEKFECRSIKFLSLFFGHCM